MAEAASQLAAELAEPPPEPQPAPPSTSEPSADVLDLSWDPKWNRELVAVAHGENSADDGESDDTWSAPWRSDRDAVEATSVGEWTSRWQASQAATDAAPDAAPDAAAEANAAAAAEAAGPGTPGIDRPARGDSAAAPGSLLGGWTPSAWVRDQAPSADPGQSSTPLHWPEPPDEPPNDPRTTHSRRRPADSATLRLPPPPPPPPPRRRADSVRRHRRPPQNAPAMGSPQRRVTSPTNRAQLSAPTLSAAPLSNRLTVST